MYIINIYVPWHSIRQNREHQGGLFWKLITEGGKHRVGEGAEGANVSAKLQTLPAGIVYPICYLPC